MKYARKLNDRRFQWLEDVGGNTASGRRLGRRGLCVWLPGHAEDYRKLVHDRPNIRDRPDECEELNPGFGLGAARQGRCKRAAAAIVESADRRSLRLLTISPIDVFRPLPTVQKLNCTYFRTPPNAERTCNRGIELVGYNA